MIVINSGTRQFNIPGADMTFGVEADAGSERKYFQCPRYVGNNLDLMGSFVRLNYRNANGEVDSYLVEDMTVDGDNVLFSWELSPKVTAYKGQIRFVLCVVGPDTKVAWHTTLGTGVVLEGLEPDREMIQAGTADVVASLITMVGQQTGAVEAEGANQIKAVQSAAQTAQSDAVAQIEAKGVIVRESIPDDYTSLENTVDSLVRGRAGAIVCSAEGSAITVNDASDMKMQGIKIFGRSTQNGVPTPDAPVEIVSVGDNESVGLSICGKNLYDCRNIPTNQLYATGVIADDDYITIEYDNTNGGTIAYRNHWTKLIDVLRPNTDYRLVVEIAKISNCTLYAVSRKTTEVTESQFRETSTFTSVGKYERIITTNGGSQWKDGACYSLRSFVSVDAGTKGVCVFRLSLQEVACTNTDYQPYKPIQNVELTHTLPGIPVASGGNYTDSDGQQWISDEVDLERGVYVQRINAVTYDGADETWALNQLGSFARFTAARNDIKNSSERTGFLCTHFTSEDITTDRVGLCFIGTSTPGQFYFYPNADITTVDQWKGWLMQNPVTVYFALATPIETPLSETEIAAYRAMHSNYPNTTVLNDAGAHMVVKYAADTKLYIDNKIKEVLG